MSFEPAIPAYRSQQCIEHYLPVASGEYSEIYQFMSFEALLLDHCRYPQWVRLLSPNLQYRLIDRRVDEAEATGSKSSAPALVSHDYHSMCKRAGEHADSGRPCPSPQAQLRRLITNLSVSSAIHRQYEVVSYILLSCVCPDAPAAILCTIERHDRLVRGGRVLHLEKREIILDYDVEKLLRLNVII